MKVQEKMILEYVASDNTIFSDAETCKEYETYLKAPKVFLIEVVHPKVKGRFIMPELLYVCKNLDDALKKVEQMNLAEYRDINIIERLLELV